MRVYIHIGKTKAASTFLQNEVFPRLPNVNFLTSDLKNISPNNLKPDKLNIISNENFYGSPGLYPIENMYRKLDMLKKRYGDPGIILITRQRKPWLDSVYNQYVKSGGKYSFHKWFMNVFDIRYLDNTANLENLFLMFSDVLTVPYEMLCYNPKEFVKIICNFMGEKPPRFNNKIYGKKLPGSIIFILRYINYIWKPSKIYRKINIKLFIRRLRGLE